MLKRPNYKGKLIVVEGIDGSGKSTQIDLLNKWLHNQGKSVYFSEWNSSALVKSTTRLGKREKMFTPTTFSLLQATDFCDRWENFILPLLKAGAIVLADRYAFTAYARDVARGVDPDWIRNLYSFAAQPDLVLYFRVSLDVAVERITSARAKIKYYEAGMDLGLSDNKVTSFRLFQQRIIDEYEKMVGEFNMTVIDGELPVEVQQKDIRKIVTKILRGWEGLPNPKIPPAGTAPQGSPSHPETGGGQMSSGNFYGAGFPYNPLGEMPGYLIVLEGSDGVGRSTHIQLLRTWLESEGYAVSDTGLKRSPFTSPGLDAAKQGHTLGSRTMSLFYAADYADRLENQIIPVLKAGFIVLSDRYFYSIIARDVVRGADPVWARKVYGFALVPDLVLIPAGRRGHPGNTHRPWAGF